jgi:hypothetical protein
MAAAQLAWHRTVSFFKTQRRAPARKKADLTSRWKSPIMAIEMRDLRAAIYRALSLI